MLARLRLAAAEYTMHFENRTVEELIQIAAAGGGIRIDARQNLIRIAAAASGQRPAAKDRV